MPARNHLPQELIDMIVAEHEDNIPTLQQCVLVCKSFLAPAQKSLFRSVVLGVDDDDPGSRRLYRRFREITTSNPVILTYVCELSMTDNSSLEDLPNSPRPSWIRDETDLPEFLATLANLQRLIFQGDLHWGSFPFSLRSSLFTIFHQLKFLGLHGFQDIPQSTCVAWKNIKGLALWAITVSEDEENEENFMTSPLAMQDTQVEWAAFQMLQESTPLIVLTTLTSQRGFFSSLKTLSFGPFDDQEVLEDWEVMKAARETLRSFSIDYDYQSWDLPPIVLGPFNLADFEKLEHISYHVTYSLDQPSSTPFSGLLSLLETLHEENNVHWIFVRVDFPDSVTATQQLTSYEGWGELDRLLGEVRFESLEFVHVALALYALGHGTQAEEIVPEELHGLERDPERMGSLEELVCTRLEDADEAGILSVSIRIVGV